MNTNVFKDEATKNFFQEETKTGFSVETEIELDIRLGRHLMSYKPQDHNHISNHVNKHVSRRAK